MTKALQLTLTAIIFCHLLFAQDSRKIDSLCKICRQAKTDSDQVIALNNLSKYYYENKKLKESDSVLQEQLHVAELSNNPNLILKTYFENSFINIKTWTTTQSSEKALGFIQKGLEYAYSENSDDYIVIGHISLASIFLNRGEIDKALYNAQKGISHLQYVVSDSIKVLMYIKLGDVYLVKGESVLAYTNYNNAFDIALTNNETDLESTVYHRLAELHNSLGDTSEAVRILVRSYKLNKEFNSKAGMLQDYLDLARTTSDPYYAEKALVLADTLQRYRLKVYAKRILLAHYTVTLRDSHKALAYINSEADLKADLLSQGLANYYFQIGEIYKYGNNPDSALYYFNLSKNDFLNEFDKNTTQSFYAELANCYSLKKDDKMAIYYYEKSFEYAKEMNDIKTISELSDSLSVLYQRESNYQKAYQYKFLATSTKDSLQQLSKSKDIALLNIERETRKHEEDVKREESKFIQKRNLQYMAISIAIGVIFLFMLFLGMFPVSKFTIKMLGYFFFISLFEFIVLLIDTLFLSHATHNEPLKLWVIKIGLIALLVPFQHLLEHGLTQFLASRKLMEFKNRISIKRFFYSFKKPTPIIIPKDEDLEEGTAVL